MDDFSKYERLRDRGTSAAEVYAAARSDGVDEVMAIRLLRRVFGLTLIEAKKITGAANAFDLPQDVRVGGKVYWEGADTIEGAWVMEAKVKEIHDGFAFVHDHRKYLVRPDGLEPVAAVGALVKIPLGYFKRTLLDRLQESADFWRQLADIRQANPQ